MTGTRRKTNEMEFQGELLNWLNVEIKKRPGQHLDRATQEKPRSASGKRNDLELISKLKNFLSGIYT